MRIWKAATGILLGFLLGACETLSYYSQAVSGHVSILAHRDSINELLNDPGTDPALQTKLAIISNIRDFARQELDLPVGKHYSQYVALDRAYAVWNVFAAPEFSLDPLAWCFPVAGCVSYRGYYREAGAHAFADRLAAQGNDVYTGGVAAYSTLGWFTDPVLSSVINRDNWQLATLLFHELAHQVVYIPGDTLFNESFATSVEQAGLQRWLAANNGADAAAELQAAAQSEARQADFVALVQETTRDLRVLYASGQSEPQMRAAKAQRVQELRESYAQLVQKWGGYTGYDNWFAQDLNNAQLGTVATYNTLVPAFTTLLEQTGSFPAFYQAVKALAELAPEARATRLDSLKMMASVQNPAKID